VSKFENVLYFDNTLREFVEGITRPNSQLTLIIGNYIANVQTDPNGFFSIELPVEINQFSEGQITVFNNNQEVIGGYKFIFILKSFQGQTYFYYPNQRIAFSLVVPGDYTGIREDTYLLQNYNCKATIRRDVTNTNFDFVKNQNLLIFPTDILSLDFNENKYVAVEMATTNEDLTECFDKWRQIGTSLQWHDFLDIDRVESDSTISDPISSPIN
jgi:hypothetical protein